MAISNSLPLKDPYPKPLGPHLSVVDPEDSEPENNSGVTFEDGAMKIEHEDGSVTINFDGKPEDKDKDEEGFHANLAKEISDSELSSIATSLLEGIQRDDDSRKDWLETRALGISLLGLKLEKPRTDAGTGAALEGMSTVRHPLLLEATVSFQATARAELLPASGPVKVRNDSPSPPKAVMQDTTAAIDLADSMENKDDLSQALEKDMNHYLTSIATEYVPDTDRMLFYVGFGGDGFKKVYNCPLRRRPVSESIDAEDLIISNAATDIRNSGRVTHRIRMRKSILRRMQILGAYRDVELNEPSAPKLNAVDRKKEDISGIKITQQRPEDRDYEIFESYCELDIDKFAPKAFKGKGLPLPYRVTLEKESRQVLDVRRNWDEDDDQCLAKHFFVQFPFIRGLGFYGLGYIHLLGNTTNALTAAWRETLDSGMYANFPGFLYAKGAGRQLSNQFRIPPGGGVGLDVGAQQNIRDAIMPLPYKDVGAGFSTFIAHVEEVGRRLASTANINVGEGKQDAPVGTTLALIEQASKVMDSAHKRLHAAQAEEFKLLKERFKEDPESFWRHNKRPTVQWKKDQFIEALNKCELVPVADPNNPTSVHRIAKAMAIKELQKSSPDLYDPTGVDMRVMRIIDVDPVGLFRPVAAPKPPDPRMVAIQAKAKAQSQQSQIQLLETQIKAATEGAAIADRQKDRDSRERVANMKIQLENLKIREEQLIHGKDEEKVQIGLMHEMNLKNASHSHDANIKNTQTAHDLHINQAKTAHEIYSGRTSQAHEITMDQERHRAEMERNREEHAQKMEHARELHQHKLEATKAMARAKPKKEKD